MKNKKYIFDCLYGNMHFPSEIYQIINVPELQRLREVRLCNINSLSITGSANTNRYEHSIGTCFLALKCMEELEKEDPFIDFQTKNNFLRAALLHDIANAAFGHSLEYIMAQTGFDPEEGFKSAIEGWNPEGEFKYKSVVHETVYMGLPRTLAQQLESDDMEEIAQNIRGEGRFGKLLCGIIDLDNIDNVYRMAYHMGVIGKTDIPLKLAKSIKIKNEEIVFTEDSIPLLWDWYYTRKKIYKLLLLNPDEFSGKCMLTECIDCVSTNDDKYLTRYDTDYEMIQKLSKKSAVTINLRRELKEIIIDENNTETELLNIIGDYLSVQLKNNNVLLESEDLLKIRYKNIQYDVEVNNTKIIIYRNITKKVNVDNIVKRLMCGELYGCIGIYESSKNEYYNDFLASHSRFIMELDVKEIIKSNCKLSIDIALHAIRDKNKTKRKLNIKTLNGDQVVIGESTDCLLIGAFIKNISFSTFQLEILDEKMIEPIEKEVYEFLSLKLRDVSLKRIKLYDEYKYIMQ